AVRDKATTGQSLTTAGPWTHVAAPSTIPSWIGCDGFAGVLAYSRGARAEGRMDGAFVRAIAFPESQRPSFAMDVDIPIGSRVKEQLRRDTGVEITRIAVRDSRGDAKPLTGVAKAGADDIRSPSSASTGLLSNLPAPTEFTDWNTRASGQLFVNTDVKVGELYERISAGPALASGNLGQGL